MPINNFDAFNIVKIDTLILEMTGLLYFHGKDLYSLDTNNAADALLAVLRKDAAMRPAHVQRKLSVQKKVDELSDLLRQGLLQDIREIKFIDKDKFDFIANFALMRYEAYEASIISHAFANKCKNEMEKVLAVKDSRAEAGVAFQRVKEIEKASHGLIFSAIRREAMAIGIDPACLVDGHTLYWGCIVSSAEACIDRALGRNLNKAKWEKHNEMQFIL